MAGLGLFVAIEGIEPQPPRQRGIGPAAEIRHLAQTIDAVRQLLGKRRERQRILILAQTQYGRSHTASAWNKTQLSILGGKAGSFEIRHFALPGPQVFCRDGMKSNRVLGVFHKARMHDGLFIMGYIRRYESNPCRGEAMYRLIVGTKDWSSWSLRAYLALMAIREPFDEVLIPLRQSDDDATKNAIRKFSGSGRVPVLEIEENGQTVTVWDSLAICETLAERHPEAQLWPKDWAARAMARSYSAEMHSGFPDLRDQLSMDFARRLPLPTLRPSTLQQIARILTSWESALARYGDHGGFLFGRFSVADCMYAPVVSRFTTFDLAVSQPVKDYMTRIWALPGMQAWLKDSQKEVEAGIA